MLQSPYGHRYHHHHRSRHVMEEGWWRVDTTSLDEKGLRRWRVWVSVLFLVNLGGFLVQMPKRSCASLFESSLTYISWWWVEATRFIFHFFCLPTHQQQQQLIVPANVEQTLLKTIYTFHLILFFNANSCSIAILRDGYHNLPNTSCHGCCSSWEH